MQTVVISWNLLIPSWAVGVIVLFLVCRATRRVQSPWLRHLPRAVVGGLAFFPSLLIADRDQIVPAAVAAFTFLGDWPAGNEFGWAFLPPILGVLAWWLSAAGFAQFRQASPLPMGRLTGISLAVFPLTLLASVVVFFAVPKVEVESILAIFLMTGTTMALGGLTGGIVAALALRRGERPRWRVVTALVLNGLAFILGLPALGWLLYAAIR